MYIRWAELPGHLETAEEINKAFTEETGDTAPWADPEDERESWRAWIEHANGNTYILAEEADQNVIKDCIARFGEVGA